MSTERFGQISLYALGIIALYGAFDIAVFNNGLAGYTQSSRAADMVLAGFSVGVAAFNFYLAKLNGAVHSDARSELKVHVG